MLVCRSLPTLFPAKFIESVLIWSAVIAYLSKMFVATETDRNLFTVFFILEIISREKAADFIANLPLKSVDVLEQELATVASSSNIGELLKIWFVAFKHRWNVFLFQL